jgi:branched-chain amino acid transport system substrate-binding protein
MWFSDLEPEQTVKISTGPAFLLVGFLLTACGQSAGACEDPLGCVSVANGENIKVAALLTLSGPDSPYGIDALRGVEIALEEQGNLAGRDIELVQVDDLCSAEGGQQGATQIAADGQIAGVIGATCSSGSVPAAKILTEAGKVLISPSSTAPSLTNTNEHQAGFFRTIYNDKAQGKSVAEFAFTVLGLRTMATIHDGTPYSNELQAAACENFTQLGGECIAQIQIESGTDLFPTIGWVAQLNPDVLYYPVYTTDGVAITSNAIDARLSAALISSDGLLSSDFLQLTQDGSRGMYLSGPSVVEESQEFTEKYLTAYGEQPIASYHLQAYDAALLLFSAIEKVAIQSGGVVLIPRQALRDELYATRGLQGISGPITCSPTGDCASPDIQIFQVRDRTFIPIYP